VLRSVKPPTAPPRPGRAKGSRVFTVAVVLLIISVAGFLVATYWPGACIAGSCATTRITSFTFPSGSTTSSGTTASSSYHGGTTVSAKYFFPNTVLSGTAVQLTVQMTNTGSQIQQARVNVTGGAFSGTSNTFSMVANSNASESVTVSVGPVNSGNYMGELVVTYYDSVGQHTAALGNFSTYVALPASLTPISWQGGGNSIGANGTTSFTVSVTNHSPNWVNSGLKIQALVTVSNSGLTLTPATISVANVGPRGTGQPYSIQVTGHNTPPGSYNIQVFLYAPNGYTLDTVAAILTLSA